MTIELGPSQTLTVEAIDRLGEPDVPVTLTSDARERIDKSHQKIQSWLDDGRVIYGITTGVGELIHNLVPPSDSATMSKNICYSHAAGTGSTLSPAMVRRAMAVRLHTFAQGYSGVQPAMTQLLQECINRNVIPVVPEQGTVSASGDLNPLAHIGVVLTGEGEVIYEGEVVPTLDAFEREGLDPITLAPKEGLSCMNGTTMTTPMGAIVVREMERLVQHALLATAITMETLHASREPLTSDVLAVRPHPGMLRVGAILRNLLDGSDLIRRRTTIEVEFDDMLDDRETVHTEDFRQDSYSIRGIPQIIGPSVETYHHCRDVVEREANSVDDNPIVFAESDSCLHSAQFHAQPVAQVMDFLKIAAAEVGVLCERQTARLLDPAVSKGLSPFLQPDELSCGYEGGQYVAGSMIAENRVLASPVSIQSLTLNGQFQDVVSMGLIAARQARRIINHVQTILAYELMVAAQAADERGIESLSPVAKTIHDEIRDTIPPLNADRPLTNDFRQLERLLEQSHLIHVVTSEHGNDLLDLAYLDRD